MLSIWLAQIKDFDKNSELRKRILNEISSMVLASVGDETLQRRLTLTEAYSYQPYIHPLTWPWRLEMRVHNFRPEGVFNSSIDTLSMSTRVY